MHFRNVNKRELLYVITFQTSTLFPFYYYYRNSNVFYGMSITVLQFHVTRTKCIIITNLFEEYYKKKTKVRRLENAWQYHVTFETK